MNSKHPSVPMSRNSDLVHKIELFSSASQTLDQHLNVDLTMNSFLKLKKLEKFVCLFERENIDLKMLLDLTQEELLSLFKYLGISAWGDKHTLKRAIEELGIKGFEAPSKNLDVHANELLTENVEVGVSEPLLENFEVDCSLCNQSSQHKCMLHKISVCNLKCSMQDPTSDNEQHHIHKTGDPRCVHLNFQCPKCDKFFEDIVLLNEHVDCDHHSLEMTPSSLTLISDGSMSDVFIDCAICKKKFENELDVLNHMERVHEYG